MGSDGLFDNVSDYELEKLVRDWLIMDLRKLKYFFEDVSMHCRIVKVKGFIHHQLESAPKLIFNEEEEDFVFNS